MSVFISTFVLLTLLGLGFGVIAHLRAIRRAEELRAMVREVVRIVEEEKS